MAQGLCRVNIEYNKSELYYIIHSRVLILVFPFIVNCLDDNRGISVINHILLIVEKACNRIASLAPLYKWSL